MIEFADSAKLHKHTQYYKLQNAGSFGNCQFKNQGKNNSTNLGGNRCWIETQILIEKDSNLGGGSVHPHLPPTELGSVPGKWQLVYKTEISSFNCH